MKRRQQYGEMLAATANSPIETITFEGNTFSFKKEYLLPYGECHYSRVFPKLLYMKESLGIIKQGDVLLETTSGSGGRAAAAVATALGYRIIIGLPAGGERAREEAILRAGGELLLTPNEQYVNGFPEFIREYLEKNPEVVYLNHCMGDIKGRGRGVNYAAINAFRPFVDEVVEAGIQPDFVMSPLGNGTTTLPLVGGFKGLFRKTKVYGVESVLAGYAHRRLWPGKYEKIFGITPEVFSRHDLPGSTPSHTDFCMPALEAAIPQLDGVALVTSNYADERFVQVAGNKPTDLSDQVVKWDDLHHSILTDFGRTGRAAFAVGVAIARKEGLRGKHFLIPVFDAIWHYDR